MIVTAVPIAQKRIISPAKNTCNSQQKQSCPKNSAALESQLSFMGLFNRSFFNAKALPDVKDDFSRQISGLKSFHFKDADFLCSPASLKSKFINSGIILLRESLPVGEGIQKLADAIGQINRNDHKTVKGCDISYFLTSACFRHYAEALGADNVAQNIKIKGLVGQGAFSSAFLTEDNKVLKASRSPLYPAPEDMVEDVELPILQRFQLGKTAERPIFAALEPFAVNSTLNRISSEDYKVIWRDFYEKIKAKNPLYSTAPDFTENPQCPHQLGTVDGKAYLLDHQSIKGRRLVGE